MKWLLIIFVVGGYPSVETQVNDLPSFEACDNLGKKISDSLKKVNSGNRYSWGCYDLSGSPQSQQ